MHDLVVVGAGPAGLAAAVYAASEGLDVLVVETHRATAGRPARARASRTTSASRPASPAGRSPAARSCRRRSSAPRSTSRARRAPRLRSRRPYAIELADGHKVAARSRSSSPPARSTARRRAPSCSASSALGVYYAATHLEAHAVRRQGGRGRRRRQLGGPGGGVPRRQLPPRAHAGARPRARRQHVALPHPAHRGEPGDHAAHAHRDRGDGRRRAPGARHLAAQGRRAPRRATSATCSS